MQIRYQNVQKNITYMSVSFAFMKKVLESVHPSFSSYATTINSKILKSSKKSKKNWCQRMTNVFNACQVSSGNDIHGSRGKKIIYFGVLVVFLPQHPRMLFPDETWQALKTFVILCHQFFLKKFELF